MTAFLGILLRLSIRVLEEARRCSKIKTRVFLMQVASIALQQSRRHAVWGGYGTLGEYEFRPPTSWRNSWPGDFTGQTDRAIARGRRM